MEARDERESWSSNYIELRAREASEWVQKVRVEKENVCVRCSFLYFVESF